MRRRVILRVLFVPCILCALPAAATSVTLDATLANSFYFPLELVDTVAGTFVAQTSESHGESLSDVYDVYGSPLVGEVWYAGAGNDAFSLDPWGIGPLTAFSPNAAEVFPVAGLFEFILPDLDGLAAEAVLDWADANQSAAMEFTTEWDLDIAINDQIVTLQVNHTFSSNPGSDIINEIGSGWVLVDAATNTYAYYDLWLESADDQWMRRGYVFMTTQDISWIPDEVEAGGYSIVGGTGNLGATVVPEPATIVIVGLGLAGLIARGTRRKN